MPSLTRFLSSFDRCFSPSPPRGAGPILVSATVDSTAYIYTFNPASRRNRDRESSTTITRVSFPGEYASMFDDMPLAKNPLRCAMAEIRVEPVSPVSTTVSSVPTNVSPVSTTFSPAFTAASSVSTNVTSVSTKASPATRVVGFDPKIREWNNSVKKRSNRVRAKYAISTYAISTSSLEATVEEDELRRQIEAATRAAQVEAARRARLEASEVSSDSSAENGTEAPVAASTPPVEEASRGRNRKVTPIRNEEVIPSPAPAAQTIDPVAEEAESSLDPVVQTVNPVVEEAESSLDPAVQTVDPAVEEVESSPDPVAQTVDPVVEEVVPSLDPAARDPPSSHSPKPLAETDPYKCVVQGCKRPSPVDGHFCDKDHRCNFVLADGRRCTNMAVKWSEVVRGSKRCENGFHDDPKDRKVLRKYINDAKKRAAQDRSDQNVNEVLCARAINTAYIGINDRVGPVLQDDHMMHMGQVMAQYRQAGLVPARRIPLYESTRYTAPIVDKKININTPIFVASPSIPACQQTTHYAPGPDQQPVSTIVRGDRAPFPLSREHFECQKVKKELENRWATALEGKLYDAIDAMSAAEAESTAKAQARAIAREVAKASAKLRAVAKARAKPTFLIQPRTRRSSAFGNLFCGSVPITRQRQKRSRGHTTASSPTSHGRKHHAIV